MTTQFRKTATRRHSRSIALALLVLLFQGCASISKNECASADWYTIGYEGGVRGASESHAAKYRKACAEHGVAFDLSRYLEGRQAGLQRFCEPRNGYRLGRAGNGYGGVCPQRLEDEFMRAYGAGRELYDSHQVIHRLGQRIGSRKSELKAVNEHIADAQAELLAASTPPPRRVLLLQEVIELRDKAKSLEREIYHTQVERDRERARLDRLERRDPAW